MKITNKLGLPQALVDCTDTHYSYTTGRYSATTILKGTTQILLERRHHDEIEQDVSDMIWMIFGTAVHSILENSAKEQEGVFKEEKVLTPIKKGYVLSGIFDRYDENEAKVTDWKTGSVTKLTFNDWEDYDTQLLIYAWQLKQTGRKCDKGELVLFMKDYKKSGKLQNSDYPPHPVHVRSLTFTDEDFKRIEKFIYDKFDEIDSMRMLDDSQLPPCSPKQRWHREDKWAVKKKGLKKAVKVYSTEEEAKQRIQEEIDKQNNHFDVLIKDDKFGVYKNNAKKPVKTFKTMLEAKKYIDEVSVKTEFYIEFREGVDSKCEEYCNANKWCPFYQQKIKDERG